MRFRSNAFSYLVTLYWVPLLVMLSSVHSQPLAAERQSLLDKLAQSDDGTIPVLVEMAQRPNSTRGRQQLKATVMRALLATDKSASNTISHKPKEFRYSALIGQRVNQAQLLQLLDNPDLKVFEDTIKRPSLEQSVNRVYPTQNSSPFHGNNQWAVAVLDTGINKNHPFLGSKVISEACYSSGGGASTISSLCPGGVNSSTAVNSGLNCALAGCEHGTQVAGVAVGNGSLFDGVARDGRLISIQVYSQINDEGFCGFNASPCLGSLTSDIISGLERVYELRNSFNIASVNLSLGSDELFSGSCDDQPEREIIDKLTAAGIAVVAATGNSGNTSQMQSPACISNAIAVAATADASDDVYSDNNISNQLDLFAPGVDITTSDSNGDFSSATGTSMAAPHVAGAWAVIKHAAPSISVAGAQSLFKNNGPNITQSSVTRRRLDVSGALNQLASQPPVMAQGDVCFPVVNTNESVAIVCL